MKKLFILMLVCLSMTVTAQTLTQRKTIANLAFGNIKLEQIVQNGDTLYSMNIKSGNRFMNYVVVGLGDHKEALRLLNVLNDVKLKDDDMLSLENVTDNVVTRGAFGCLPFNGI